MIFTQRRKVNKSQIENNKLCVPITIRIAPYAALRETKLGHCRKFNTFLELYFTTALLFQDRTNPYVVMPCKFLLAFVCK